MVKEIIDLMYQKQFFRVFISYHIKITTASNDILVGINVQAFSFIAE